MTTKEQEEQWQRADDEVRKNLPPGVKLLRTLRGHTDWIGRIAWSPDGRLLASPSEDETIRLWDAQTGECLRTLEGHKKGVRSVAFDPTESRRQGELLERNRYGVRCQVQAKSPRQDRHQISISADPRVAIQDIGKADVERPNDHALPCGKPSILLSERKLLFNTA